MYKAYKYLPKNSRKNKLKAKIPPTSATPFRISHIQVFSSQRECLRMCACSCHCATFFAALKCESSATNINFRIFSNSHVCVGVSNLQLHVSKRKKRSNTLQGRWGRLRWINISGIAAAAKHNSGLGVAVTRFLYINNCVHSYTYTPIFA